MGCSFPLEPSAEITSQNRCSEWDALSGRASGGKRIPEFGSRVGHTFRLELQPESASRNPRLEWDALSGTALNRKPRPRISLQSGTPFPAESSGGKFIPELALGVGHGFRMEPQRKLYPSLSVYSGIPFPLGVRLESLSRSRHGFRDAVSARHAIWKAHPVLSTQSGTWFPRMLPTGKCVSVW